MDWQEVIIKGANFDLVMSGALEGTKKLSIIIAKQIITMPFKIDRLAPRILSVQPREAFFIIILRLQPKRLHKTRTMTKITAKLNIVRNLKAGRYSFRYSVIWG
jgi:hypothetical protein